MKSILIIFIVTTQYIICQMGVGGTTAILYKDTTGIFVGIDSKISRSDKTSIQGAYCKIKIINDVIIFADGTPIVSNYFNAYALAESSIVNNNSLSEIGKDFNDRVNGLCSSLKYLRDQNKKSFDELFPKRKLFDFCFVKKNQNTVEFYCKQYGFSVTSTNLFLEIYPSGGLEINDKFKIFGEWDAIVDSLKEWKKDIFAQCKTPDEISENIYRLIKIQSLATPEYVGEPIYVLYVNKNDGLHWMKLVSPCNNIESIIKTSK